jgi:heme/copper-type cytochrome/quinol oxidase subunit 2
MMTWRTIGFAVLGAGACLLAGSVLPGTSTALGAAQEQPPNRREFSITARDFTFSPNRLEVTQNDLVKVTVESADIAYGFAIDQFKISRRVPPGGKTVIEFRADQEGTFSFYSNMTSDERHAKMRGDLVVRRR